MKTKMTDLQDLDMEEILEWVNNLEDENEMLTASVMDCADRVKKLVEFGTWMRKADYLWGKIVDAVLVNNTEVAENYLIAMANLREHLISILPDDIIVKEVVNKESSNIVDGNDTTH